MPVCLLVIYVCVCSCVYEHHVELLNSSRVIVFFS